jgi:hypothetical protein
LEKTEGGTDMWIILLESRLYIEQISGAARELGLKIGYVSQKQASIELAKNYIDKSFFVEKITFNSVNIIIQKEFGNNKSLIFWTMIDFYVSLVAKLNGNSKGHKRETALVCKNKYLVRKMLEGTSYNPRYKLISEEEIKTSEKVPFENSFVIKPLLGFESIGVEKIMNNYQYHKALQRTASVLERLKKINVDYFEDNPDEIAATSILAEDFIEGEEYSIEMFVDKNGPHCLGICEKSKMHPPYFEEITYCIPANITSANYETLAQAGEDITRLLGIHSGEAHLEVILSPKGVKLLDVGLRIGGGGITHALLENSFGINFIKAVLANPYITAKTNDTGLLYLLQVCNGGIVKKLPEKIDSKKIENSQITDFRIFVKIGDTLTPYPNFSGLPGFILFKIPESSENKYDTAKKIIDYCEKNFCINYI